MPTYLYLCPECDLTEEVAHSLTTEPLTLCANCGYKMDRKPQATSNAFRGSGFYTTDKVKK